MTLIESKNKIKKEAMIQIFLVSSITLNDYDTCFFTTILRELFVENLEHVIKFHRFSLD